jgi:hypothetical protein
MVLDESKALALCNELVGIRPEAFALLITQRPELATHTVQLVNLARALERASVPTSEDAVRAYTEGRMEEYLRHHYQYLEMFASAFVQISGGLMPEEAELVEQRLDDGSTRWFFQKRMDVEFSDHIT